MVVWRLDKSAHIGTLMRDAARALWRRGAWWYQEPRVPQRVFKCAGGCSDVCQHHAVRRCIEDIFEDSGTDSLDHPVWVPMTQAWLSLQPVKNHIAGPWFVVALQQSIQFLDIDVNPSIPTYTSTLALVKFRTIFVCAPQKTIQPGDSETLFLFSFAPFVSCLLASDPSHIL